MTIVCFCHCNFSSHNRRRCFLYRMVCVAVLQADKKKMKKKRFLLSSGFTATDDQLCLYWTRLHTYIIHTQFKHAAVSSSFTTRHRIYVMKNTAPPSPVTATYNRTYTERVLTHCPASRQILMLFVSFRAQIA